MKLLHKPILALALLLLAATAAQAQQQPQAKRPYPSSEPLPADLVWMREVYRTLDLTKDANGALYFPTEPQGDRMNLFTTIFRLLAQNKIPAYEYQLDGTEHFQESYKTTFRDVLDRFQIYYELKKVANRRDSVISIHNSDIPSADVQSYFIKEVWYFDQRTSTYGTAVTALCPVMHRTEVFSSEPVTMPMFWIDYKDLAPYLAEKPVMMSDYNNAANNTWDNFFASRLYEGDIYKVTNLQNRTLAQYCTTDSAMTAEQQRIEKQLTDFERVLYGSDYVDENDTTDVDTAADEQAEEKRTSRRKRQKDDTEAAQNNEPTQDDTQEEATEAEEPAQEQKATKAERRKKSKSTSSKASSSRSSRRSSAAPKASVRRQRH